MDINGIPLFSMLQNKLSYLAERQKVIAQNVANSSTPGFTPQDLKPFDKQPGAGRSGSAGAAVQLAQTEGGALAGAAAAGGGKAKAATFASVASPDSETTLDGNQVVLEEQMIKMSDARTEYDAAVGFYQKALGMLHQAVQKPGA